MALHTGIARWRTPIIVGAAVAALALLLTSVAAGILWTYLGMVAIAGAISAAVDRLHDRREAGLDPAFRGSAELLPALSMLILVGGLVVANEVVEVGPMNPWSARFWQGYAAAQLVKFLMAVWWPPAQRRADDLDLLDANADGARPGR